MAVNIETLGTLERRVSVSVRTDDVERQVGERLKELAKTAKLPGFRPGKVPVTLVAKQYGSQVKSEVLTAAVQQAFDSLVKEADLKVAGYPRIEKKEGADDNALEFSATFEVYPEIKIGDIAAVTIERPTVTVDDAAVERTIDILRKQRTQYVEGASAAKEGDRVTVDFEGKIDGVPFAGGKGTAMPFVIGDGRMLGEFDAAVRGMSAGESKDFELKFPEDYHGKEVAGKTAVFSVAVKRVEAGHLPPLDAELAKALGVASGDVEQMRTEIRANVEREVKKRIETRLKNQTLQALHDSTQLDLPMSLVQMEVQRMVEATAQDLQARGLRMDKLPLDPAVFETNARRRVALGLLIGELQRVHSLKPKPAEVRALIEREAQAYESPAEVVKWFYMQPQRLSEMEGLALESKVVDWILANAKVVDKAISFDELMESNA